MAARMEGNDFSLKGWEKVGNNVDWATLDPGKGSSQEVYRGKHSIRINRKRSTELDDAEGIISDFIPVIPGNYYFTCTLRLKNIVSNRYRLGAKLNDAIVIKVSFFNEHQEPLDSGYLNPNTGSPIDNSNKNYAFSNFWRIDDFPWGTVRGRTYHYPFSEGDTPDGTRFVRLFFGLKGSGTLWLDDVDYRYSEWNFTALERFKPFFGRQLAVEEKIIPTPKSLTWIGDIRYYRAGQPIHCLPVIILPRDPSPAERTAAKVLQNKIESVLKKFVGADRRREPLIRVISKNPNITDISKSTLIYSIGRNEIFRSVQPDVPLKEIRGKQQGYIIKTQQIDGSRIVFLLGETPIGSFNAVATAVQLLNDNVCIYHDATVVDYPDFLGRSYVFKNWKSSKELQKDLDNIERMSLYKLNKVYFGYDRTRKSWHQIDPLYREGIIAAGKRINENGAVSLAMMVNPYSHFKMGQPAASLGDRVRHQWTHSNPDSFTTLQEIFKVGLEAGAGTIMLLSDDYLPHTGKSLFDYSLYALEDKNRFVNLQNAQAHIINKLKQWLDAEYPHTRFEFCPPWYSNEHIDRSDGRAELYLKELAFQIPQEVAVIWTGPTVRSLSIDMADLFRYMSLIGRPPMIWDNTLYARNLETSRYGGYTAHYPGKVRMCNLFEPYHTYRPIDFQRYNQGREMYTNGSAHSEVYKLKYATVADYQWNTAAYNPELSLWKILCQTYGSLVAEKLIRFSDAYYGIYGTCLRIETEGQRQPYLIDAKNFLSDLDNYLLDISRALPQGHPLVEELKKYGDRQQKRYEKLTHPQSGRLF
ncbi:MAG: beta-N-acetylglucosaminidase domain-containing protein [Desulfobacterales bacterium]